MKRKQFTFYRSFWEAIEQLPTNKEKLQAFEMICCYGLNQTLPEIKGKKPNAAIVFEIAKPVLDAAHKRAEHTAKINNVLQ